MESYNINWWCHVEKYLSDPFYRSLLLIFTFYCVISVWHDVAGNLWACHTPRLLLLHLWHLFHISPCAWHDTIYHPIWTSCQATGSLCGRWSEGWQILWGWPRWRWQSALPQVCKFKSFWDFWSMWLRWQRSSRRDERCWVTKKDIHVIVNLKNLCLL